MAAARIDAALVQAVAAIARFTPASARNGESVHVSALPTVIHVAPQHKWRRAPAEAGAPGHQSATLQSHVAQLAGADAEVLPAGRVSIRGAVVVAIARLTAERVFALTPLDFNAVEIEVAPNVLLHENHAAAFAEAVADLAESSTRAWGVAIYNAISMALSQHHHVPQTQKALYTTTARLLGLDALVTADPQFETAMFHDCFHPLSMAWFSQAARNMRYRDPLNAINLSNLAKRLPIKAPDTAVAINYGTLIDKCREFPAETGAAEAAAVAEANADAQEKHQVAENVARAAHAAAAAAAAAANAPAPPEFFHPAFRPQPVPPVVDPLPAALDAPPALANHIAAWTTAEPGNVAAAVRQLVTDATNLAKPSAYLAGYLLGKLRRRDMDPDLSLRSASRSMTILGAPVYARLSQEYPGTFAAGLDAGYRRVVPAAGQNHVAEVVAGLAAAVANVT